MPIVPSPGATRRRWQFTIAALGSGALFACGHARAQTTGVVSSSAIIQPTGPRTGTGGTNNFNAEGSGNSTNADFGVLDFSAAAFNLGSQTLTGVQGGTLTLTLTESDAAFTLPSSLEFYLTTNNSANIVAGTSTLKYQAGTATASNDPPYGIDPTLGALAGNANGTLYDLGSGAFTTTGNTKTGQVDTFTLTLASGAATQAFIKSFSSAGGSDLRLLVAATTASGSATFYGATTTTATNRPSLSFTPIVSTANNLYWQAGSGTWNASGDTNWNTANSSPGTTSWNNDGTHIAAFSNTPNSTVAVGAGIQAAGIQFDVNGYTLNAAAGTTALTLVGSNAFVQVTNATDTATINAPLAGTAGMNKTGAGTLVLGGTNTYTGGTTLTGGTLQVNADANLGDASGGLTFNGGTLHVNATSLSTTRAFGGSGTVQVDSHLNGGNTVPYVLTTSGVVNMASLTLSGAGTFGLTNNTFSVGNGNASNQITGTVTFTTAGGTLTTSSDGTNLDGQGVINLGGVSATQASGTVTLAANANLTAGATVTMNVANSGATLNVSGVTGTAVVAKTGAGTLVLNGDNSGLAGTGATAASFRQGTAGANPVNGGTISISASNPNPNYALGTAQYQANGGTLSNDSGKAVSLPASVSISLGASNSTATPGGLVFAGANSITVNGSISQFPAGSTPYQHALTVNTPTTFTGVLAATTGGTSTGLTILGSSTLTLSGTAPNAFTEPVTIATSGTGSGVTLAAAGALAQNTGITLNAGATLTINTGALSGTVDTINDAALVSLTSGSKVVLSIGTGKETVGGLYLSSGDGTLAAGYQPAGTYGATGSGAQHIDNNLFSGTGVFNNLGTATAVPEPSAWGMALAGLGVLAFLGLRRRA